MSFNWEFLTRNAQANAPGRKIVVVTASDSEDIDPTRAIVASTEGVATVIDADGNQITAFPIFKGYNPISVTRIFSTGLTASGLFAIY